MNPPRKTRKVLKDLPPMPRVNGSMDAPPQSKVRKTRNMAKKDISGFICFGVGEFDYGGESKCIPLSSKKKLTKKGKNL